EVIKEILMKRGSNITFHETEEKVEEQDQGIALLDKWKSDHETSTPPTFLTIETTSGEINFYEVKELQTKVPSQIIEGIHSATVNSTVYSKNAQGEWVEKVQPLQKIINEHFKLKRLYKPVWAYATAGLKWGMLIGVILKLLDTSIGLFAVDAGAGFCFLIAIAVCFLPKIGFVAAMVASFMMGKYYNFNFFMAGLSSAAIGAILGCLPGMAIGGIIGLSKKDKVPLAYDFDPEQDAGFTKAVLYPLIGGAAVICFYFFTFNPWLMKIMSQ
ncbi:MAG: hypothetical protein JXR56_05165, partial [Candidatus Cloacimonetes bacterium]|nr:hypothetical protein [Candidatus Cloacimonadota bacterium]